MLERQTDRSKLRHCETLFASFNMGKHRSNLVRLCNCMTCGRLLRSFNLFNNTKLKSRNDKYTISAFTLAEVLITLGIIGIVAAMTIPSLMKNYQESQFKQSAKEAYSKASQAVQQMRNDEGDSLSSYIANTGSFKPVFMTYFKILKDYGSASYTAITTSSCTYKTLFGATPNCNSADDGQFVTTDGMFWGFDNHLCPIRITVDVNFSKPPNVYGVDTFLFQIVNDNLLPMGAPGTSWAAGNCNRTSSSSVNGFGCMYNVMQGIDY